MNPEIQSDNNNQSVLDKQICDLLAKTIDETLKEAER